MRIVFLIISTGALITSTTLLLSSLLMKDSELTVTAAFFVVISLYGLICSVSDYFIPTE
ncbi:MAG: hypothetical protein ACK4NF_04530 [Planctomycetota bacterium]